MPPAVLSCASTCVVSPECGLSDHWRWTGHKALENYLDSDCKTAQFVRPMHKGRVNDMGALQRVWHGAFQEVPDITTGTSLICSESVSAMKCEREAVTTMAFEEFKMDAFYLSIASVLSLYASGRTTGTVVDVGHDRTTVIAIYEGYSLPHTCTSTDLAGHAVTQFLGELLGVETDPRVVARLESIKEANCHLCSDSEAYSLELTGEQAIDVTLPDGQSFKLGPTHVACAELMIEVHSLCFKTRIHTRSFKTRSERDVCLQPRVKPLQLGQDMSPELLRKLDATTVQQTVVDCWNRSDNDCKGDLTSNTLLSGGGSLVSGDFGGRLQIECAKRHNFGTVKVVSPPLRGTSTWIGGSILATLSTFEGMWITREEFDDAGPIIVHRKCF